MDREAAHKTFFSLGDYPLLVSGCVIGSTVMGYASARSRIDDGLYDALKRDGVFKDFYADYIQKLQGSAETERLLAIEGKATGTYKDQVKQLRQDFFAHVKERRHAMGIHTFSDELKIVQRSFKHEALLVGITVGTVMLGSTLSAIQFLLPHNNIER